MGCVPFPHSTGTKRQGMTSVVPKSSKIIGALAPEGSFLKLSCYPPTLLNEKQCQAIADTRPVNRKLHLELPTKSPFTGSYLVNRLQAPLDERFGLSATTETGLVPKPSKR